MIPANTQEIPRFTSAPLRPRVGLLALSLELYESLAPDLRPGREQWLRRDVIPELERHFSVSFDGAVFRREDVSRAIMRFEAEGVDGLLIVHLAYSPSQITLPAIRATRLPVMLWNTQELETVDGAFQPAAMIDNHGVHGTQDLANTLSRCGVKFDYLTSHWREAEGLRELSDFLTAAAAVRRLRSARIGLMGYPFPGMGDFAVDTTNLTATLGCSWVVLTIEDFIKLAVETGPQTVNELVSEYRHSYQIASDITDADLAEASRAEFALRTMVKQNSLDALTYQFMAFGDDERVSTTPFVAASRLMAEGIGFGGEGDLIAAAGSALVNWLKPPASFSEMFTIDFGGNSLFMSHMGEANVAMARKDRKTRLVARPTQITRTRNRQLALATSFEPGPATLAALTIGPNGRWRLIASSVSIEDFGPLDSFVVPHFKLKPAGDVRSFLSAYALAGGPHHNAVCFGDARPRLRMAAGLLDADYIEI